MMSSKSVHRGVLFVCALLACGAAYALEWNLQPAASAMAEEIHSLHEYVMVLVTVIFVVVAPSVIGRSMIKAGCQIERFLAPVEPGNLFLLGYKDDVPIVSAPGCFRSAKPNVVDLMLPPMLARYRVSRWEVACLGHGGLFA